MQPEREDSPEAPSFLRPPGLDNISDEMNVANVSTAQNCQECRSTGVVTSRVAKRSLGIQAEIPSFVRAFDKGCQTSSQTEVAPAMHSTVLPSQECAVQTDALDENFKLIVSREDLLSETIDSAFQAALRQLRQLHMMMDEALTMSTDPCQAGIDNTSVVLSSTTSPVDCGDLIGTALSDAAHVKAQLQQFKDMCAQSNDLPPGCSEIDGMRRKLQQIQHRCMQLEALKAQNEKELLAEMTSLHS